MSRSSQDRSEEPVGGAQSRAEKLGLRPSSPDLPFVAGALGFCLGALVAVPQIISNLPRFLSLWWSSIADTATGSPASVPRILPGGAPAVPIASLLVSLAIPFLLSIGATMAVALFQRGSGSTREGHRRPRVFRRPFTRGGAQGQPALGYRMLRALAVIAVLIVATPPILRSAAPGSSLFVSRNPQKLLLSLLTPGVLFLGMLLVMLLAVGLVDREYRRRILFDALKLDPSQAREERRLMEGDSTIRLAMRRRLAGRLRATTTQSATRQTWRDGAAPSSASIPSQQAVKGLRGSASRTGDDHA